MTIESDWIEVLRTKYGGSESRNFVTVSYQRPSKAIKSGSIQIYIPARLINQIPWREKDRIVVLIKNDAIKLIQENNKGYTLTRTGQKTYMIKFAAANYASILFPTINPLGPNVRIASSTQVGQNSITVALESIKTEYND